MKTNDLVSIIIPCHNHAQHLEESVNCAVGQSYPNIEIIIVNDGSTDNTEEVARNLQAKYPEKIQVISQKNSGVSVARNNAIGQAKGRYILPLDADDLIGQKMVELSLKSMIGNRADIVYVDTQCFGTKNYLIKKLPFSKNNFLYENLCNATSLFKKKMWKKIGGYAENMKEGYEDWEFWINAYKEGYKFQLLSEPLLLYRTQEVSRNTEAEAKDTYIKAKITLNHPELYTIGQVQNAIDTVRKTEHLANIYFYGTKDLSIDEKKLANSLSSYLATNKLKKQQLIDILDTNKKIGLFTMDMLKNNKHPKKQYKRTGVEFILFYAPMRYKLPLLQNLDFAWDKKRGIIKASGSMFPFILKSTREDKSMQHIASKRLVRYLNKKNNDLLVRIEQQKNDIKNKIVTVEKQEARIQNKNRLIEEKDGLIRQRKRSIENKNGLIEQQKRSIENKNGLIEQQKRSIENKNGLIEQQKRSIENKNGLIEQQKRSINESNIKREAIMQATQKVISFPMTKSPIQKYEAYKSMLQIYMEVQDSE